MANTRNNPNRTSIPLQLHSFSNMGDMHILVNAKLAKQKITLIVDTGCSLTALRANIYHQGTPVELQHSEQEAYSISGAINCYSLVEINSLTIGRLLLPPTIVSLIDFPDVQKLYLNNFGITIDGLLGCDILNRCKASISLTSKTLTLFNPAQ